VSHTLFSLLRDISKDHSGYLVGFFNIESGEVAISDERFPPCDHCWNNREILGSCSECGKDGTNFIKMRSGAGDGVYSAFRFFKEGDPVEAIGGMLLLDFALNASAILPFHLDQDGSRINDLDLSDITKDRSGEYIGSVVCKYSEDEEDDATFNEQIANLPPGAEIYIGGLEANRFAIYVGDAAANDDGSFALLSIGVNPGRFHVYLFEDIAIFLTEKAAKDFGMPTVTRLSNEDLHDYVLGKSNEDVRAHLEPAGLGAVHWNYLLECKALSRPSESIEAAAIEPNIVASSWAAQLAHVKDPNGKKFLKEFLDEIGFRGKEADEYTRNLLHSRGINSVYRP